MTEQERSTLITLSLCVCAGTPVCCSACCICAVWPGGLATVHHLHECIIAVRSLDGFTFRMEDR